MSKSDNAAKGKLLESIVAALHESPNVHVEKNVRLPSNGGAKRKREIDVLLTTEAAGYPIRLAIECKNYNKKIGAKEIDAYLGKMEDIGIPPQLGIYVTVKGYTSGARSRAKTAGLRVLTLKGLSEDGLSAQLADAIQAVIFVLPLITKMSISNNVKTSSTVENLSFFDQANEFVGTVPDLILYEWRTNRIPSELGMHRIDVPIPEGWVQRIDNRKEPPISIVADVLVRGHAIVMPGYATNYHLIDLEKRQLEKLKTNVSFESLQTKYPLHTFDSEAELARFWVGRDEHFKLSIGRFRLPRARMGNLYWPPSQRIRQAVDEYMALSPNLETNPDDLQRKFAELAGDDLSAIWDPI